MNSFFVYAGLGDKNKSYDDFYFLNISNWTWKKLFWLDIPL